MAKVNERANANQQAQKEAQYALKGFPRAAITAAFGKIAEQAEGVDKANSDKSAAAYDVLILAHKFREKNANVPLETVVKGFAEAMNGVALILAQQGNRFAEIVKGKGKNPDSARFTGYGDNVKSIAKGVLEFELNPAEVLNDQGHTGFRVVRTRVQELRQQVRQEKNPDLAAMKDATAKLDAAWKELRTKALAFNDVQVLTDLETALRSNIAQLEAAKAEQDATEKAAKEAAAKGKTEGEEPTEENTAPETEPKAEKKAA